MSTPSQLDKLKEDWDVLLVLDACRFDELRALAPEVECVCSPATDTPGWLQHVAPLIEDATYFTANPVVSQEVVRGEVKLRLVDVWGEHFGDWTTASVQSVHPASVTSAYLMWRRQHDARRVVLHFLQPHTPYLGEAPLSFEWADGVHPNVYDKLADETLTWVGVREAYRASLGLAWQAIQNLAPHLQGSVVVTADHGELLGEGNLFGHGSEPRFDRAEVRQVPWLVLDVSRSVEMATVQRRLRALGYT